MTTLERRLEDAKDAMRRFAKASRENAPPDECNVAVRELCASAVAWDKADRAADDVKRGG